MDTYNFIKAIKNEDLNNNDKIEINGYTFTACDEIIDYFQNYLSELITKYAELFEYNPSEPFKINSQH